MRKAHYSLAFSAFLFLFFSWAAWEARAFSDLARFFPYYIAIAAVILSFINVVGSILALIKEKKALQVPQEMKAAQPPTEESAEEEGPILRYLIWIIGYIVLIYIIGFLAATTLFLLLFLYYESKFGVLKTALSVVVVHALIFVFASALNLYWPEGIFPLWPF